MISNAMVAHNFAHGVKPNLTSGNMFWEMESDGTRKIYSYGHHFCIATVDAAGQNCLFTTRGYSNTTSKHIGDVRGAIRGLFNVIYVHDPDAWAPDTNIKQYAAEIENSLRQLKTSKTRAASYMREIESTYSDAVKYRDFLKLKKTEFKPVEKIYKTFKDFTGTAEFQAFLTRQNENAARYRAAVAERQRRKRERRAAKYAEWEKQRQEREKQERLTSPERVEKWERGENVYLSYIDTAENVPLRFAARKGYTVIETGKGVIVPLNEARRVAGLILAGDLSGLTVNETYKIREYDAQKVVIGCHVFKTDYLREWAQKVVNVQPF